MDHTVDHEYWRERMSEGNSAQSEAAIPEMGVGGRKTKANKKKGGP